MCVSVVGCSSAGGARDKRSGGRGERRNARGRLVLIFRAGPAQLPFINVETVAEFELVPATALKYSPLPEVAARHVSVRGRLAMYTEQPLLGLVVVEQLPWGFVLRYNNV